MVQAVAIPIAIAAGIDDPENPYGTDVIQGEAELSYADISHNHFLEKDLSVT